MLVDVVVVFFVWDLSWFDVIVIINMFGDIFFDFVIEFVGGFGFVVFFNFGVINVVV